MKATSKYVLILSVISNKNSSTNKTICDDLNRSMYIEKRNEK